MCFSAETSFGSGGLMSLIGLATLAKVRHWREILLGALPLLFGIHQLEEGVVWLALEGRASLSAGRWAAWLYILFAQSLLTAICPWGFWLIEPKRRHRWLLVPLVILGTGLCLFTLWKLTEGEVVARIHNHGIEYVTPVRGSWWFLGLYVAATSFPALLSSYPWMFRFGVVNLISLGVAAYVKHQELTSVWCAFAAVVSVLIFLHFRRVRSLDAVRHPVAVERVS